MLRTLQIGPRQRDLLLKVAERDGVPSELTRVDDQDSSIVRLGPARGDARDPRRPIVRFDGDAYLEMTKLDGLDTETKDYSIVAKIRTNGDGSIWSLTTGEPKWMHDGQAFFIRNGKLGFDIGWVGAVAGKTKVSDGQWHTVALTWKQASKTIRLYVDGKLDGEGTLAPKGPLSQRIARIGFTSPNFPSPNNCFRGSIAEIRFYQERLVEGLTEIGSLKKDHPSLRAQWNIEGVEEASHGTGLKDYPVEIRRIPRLENPEPLPLVAGVTSGGHDARWEFHDGNLCLRIPAGNETLRMSIWLASDDEGIQPSAPSPSKHGSRWMHPPAHETDLDLSSLIGGGPSRWPELLTTQAIVGSDQGPFAIDILTAPESNPWLAQMRFTGLDFFDDGRIAICTWDGDVWTVTPDASANGTSLQWRRIATGLFQPLGIKIVRAKFI